MNLRIASRNDSFIGETTGRITFNQRSSLGHPGATEYPITSSVQIRTESDDTGPRMSGDDLYRERSTVKDNVDDNRVWDTSHKRGEDHEMGLLGHESVG
jgi:hypothetical protein